jgi:hypothetical protein
MGKTDFLSSRGKIFFFGIEKVPENLDQEMATLFITRD